MGNVGPPKENTCRNFHPLSVYLFISNDQTYFYFTPMQINLLYNLVCVLSSAPIMLSQTSGAEGEAELEEEEEDTRGTQKTLN